MRNDDMAFTLGILICELLIFVPIAIFMIVVSWKLFQKAGQEGWKCLIPIYGTYVLTVDIAGKDTTTFVLHLIPFVNIYARIVTSIALAKSFGKDEGFGIGLAFLGIVFYPILAFNKKITYLGPGGEPLVKDSSNSLTTDWQNPNKPTDI